MLKTHRMGGREEPSIEELVAMQQGDYVLLVRDGKLIKVAAKRYCSLMIPADMCKISTSE